MGKTDFAQAIVGMKLMDAADLGDKHGFKLMPIFLNGESLIHIANYDNKRAKVSVRNGKIDSFVEWG